tara:strand:- start:1580 stop:2494 length:915 start_codon:yes stop_codon:yes gene_type:complete
MEMSDLKMIFDKCNKEGIPSYTELILGLPLETFDTWKSGLCEVIEAGQHNAIESWLAQLLENAHMNLPSEIEKHGITSVIVEDYISGFEEEDNISEKVNLVTGTKHMPTDKFIDSWLYAWMINNFHNFGWSQVIARFLRMHNNVSYINTYDVLWEAIQNDTGIVNQLFEEAKGKITHYLATGKSENFSGHTLMWEAQKDFHLHSDKVLKFVKDVFTEEHCNLDADLYYNLIAFQQDYTTTATTEYPFQATYKYNFFEYINGIEDFNSNEPVYTVDIAEPVTGDEYYNRLYFRRRQGWGKSLFSV